MQAEIYLLGTTQKYFILSEFCVDLSTPGRRLQCNGLILNFGIRALLKGKYHCKLDMGFPFVCRTY